MREYYTDLAERAAIGMHGPDEGAWVERMLPDYDNLRAAFEHAIADRRRRHSRFGWSRSLSEFVHLRIGYESSGWAERTVDLAEPDHPLLRRRRRLRRTGSVEQGSSSTRARSLASWRDGRVPGRGNGRVAYPGDVLADLAAVRG